MQKQQFLFIGHRGFRKKAVENSFDAFDKALDYKMDYVEFDIHLSKDGTLYVHHDPNLKRLFGIDLEIKDADSEYLDGLVFPGTNLHIPKLSDVFDRYYGKIGFMIELKGPNTGKALADFLNDVKSDKFDNIVVSGRSLKEFGDFNSIHPEIPLCHNISKSPDFSLETFYGLESKDDMPLNFRMISLDSHRIVNSEFIDKCHQFNIIALSWNFMNYFNPVGKIKKLYKLGIDGILFDSPNDVKKFKKIL